MRIATLAALSFLVLQSAGCLHAVGVGLASASSQIAAGLAVAGGAAVVNQLVTQGQGSMWGGGDNAGDEELRLVVVSPQRAERTGDEERRWIAMEMGWYAPGLWPLPPIPSIDVTTTGRVWCGDSFSLPPECGARGTASPPWATR